MRLIDLFEAPISNIETHHMDQPGTFGDSDRKLLQNPQHIAKIVHRFANTDLDFNLFFVNQPGKDYLKKYDFDDGTQTVVNSDAWEADYEHAGISTPEQIEQHFGFRVSIDPHAINVVFLSNANAALPIPITPWMVAHRFGHSITDNKDRLPPAIRKLIDQLPTAGENQIFFIPELRQYGVGATLSYADVATMRSTRQKQLLGDIREELIAQYLITGQITFKLPDDFAQVPVPYINTVRAKVGEKARYFTGAIDALLNQCVGQVFVAL